MRLTTVLSAVNENPHYYMFIPKQILFWKKFDINFIVVYIGEKLPEVLKEYTNNIILWKNNLDLNSAFVSQNIRIYYPALINIPDDEMVMITDIDMLPTNDRYYKHDIEKYDIDDFIYYRHIDNQQIYMCYNAAHPKIWSTVFSIKNEKDIEDNIYTNYDKTYNGVPGSNGWFIDQETMYNKLIVYPHLKVLNRPIKRLETYMLINHIEKNDKNFIYLYDDVHFHRSYLKNEKLILYTENNI